VRIALIVEGKTEKAFMPCLRSYLKKHLSGEMPNLDVLPYNGRLPSREKLNRVVVHLLADRNKPADFVIALTDVYTGSQPPDFIDATGAKLQMREWVGSEPRFRPHAAQHDFEAWLLPYWDTIQKLAGHNRAAPAGNPEAVNHTKPPAYHLQEIFRLGTCRDDYVKPRDAARILRDNDLALAISQCSELKAFVNSILSCCGANTIA